MVTFLRASLVMSLSSQNRCTCSSIFSGVPITKRHVLSPNIKKKLVNNREEKGPKPHTSRHTCDFHAHKRNAEALSCPSAAISRGHDADGASGLYSLSAAL